MTHMPGSFFFHKVYLLKMRWFSTMQHDLIINNDLLASDDGERGWYSSVKQSLFAFGLLHSAWLHCM